MRTASATDIEFGQRGNLGRPRHLTEKKLGVDRGKIRGCQRTWEKGVANW